MGTVVKHPSVVEAERRELAAKTTDFAEGISAAASLIVRAQCGDLPDEAHNGLVAMACLSAAARASFTASVAMGSDPLDDWRRAATLGEAIIADALERAAAKQR